VGLQDAVASEFKDGKVLTLKADEKEVKVRARIDTPQELLYYKNGGILQYVLRQLAG
jgi:aconitate hydratase